MAQQAGLAHRDCKISWKNNLNCFGTWTVKKWRCKDIETTLVQFETNVSVAPKIFNTMVVDLQDVPDQPAGKHFSSILQAVIHGNATLGNHTIEFKTGNAALGEFYCYNSAGFNSKRNIGSVKHIEEKLYIDLDSIGVNFTPNNPNTINLHVKFNVCGGRHVEFLAGFPHFTQSYAVNIHLHSSAHKNSVKNADELNSAVNMRLGEFVKMVKNNRDTFARVFAGNDWDGLLRHREWLRKCDMCRVTLAPEANYVPPAV